ncbi:MAG: hypothetical protein DMF59_11745 [Acidobacteria bacterium]|nr:MAG: hypothetical protein DMF59_11745 [Acidobacteriota bacterium]
MSENRKILVVDDDESIRVMVERVLRREQYQVDSARDGFEAIEKLAQTDYNAILLDLMMPGLDGLGVLDYLEEHRPELESSVIIMSANLPAAYDTRRMRKVGKILPKPFDLSDLIAQVRGSDIAL